MYSQTPIQYTTWGILIPNSVKNSTYYKITQVGVVRKLIKFFVQGDLCELAHQLRSQFAPEKFTDIAVCNRFKTAADGDLFAGFLLSKVQSSAAKTCHHFSSPQKSMESAPSKLIYPLKHKKWFYATS